MPPTTSQKNAITQFMAFTSASEKVAASFMKRHAYKLDAATDAYFNTYPAAATPVNDKADINLNAIFDQFRDEVNDEKDIITIQGTMKYLEELGVDLDDVGMLVPLEVIHAPAMGEMSREEFVKGWKSTGSKPCDTIAKQQAWVKTQIPLLSTDITVFKRVYKHTFISAKDRGQKAIALDNAIIYWQLLFSPSGMPWVTKSTNWLALWVEFLHANWKKSVNKDMWNMTLEFFTKTLQDEDLSFWSEDGAWPGVIDDFVGYVKEKRASGADKMETD